MALRKQARTNSSKRSRKHEHDRQLRRRPRGLSYYTLLGVEPLEERRMLAAATLTGLANQANTYILEMDATVANQLDLTLNGVAQAPVALSPVAANNTITINGAGDSNLLTVTEQNGTNNGLIPATITYLANSGFPNTLILNQVGAVTSTSDTYSVGPAVGSGSDIIVGNTTQTVNFTSLSPVLDTVIATTATVNGTNGSNAINYTSGVTSPDGLVTVDNQESYEFNNKTNLIINGEAGNDQINLDNQNATKPTNLTSITVNGNDPTGPLSDTLTVNGVATIIDGLIDTPTGTGAGTVTDTGVLAFVPVTYSGLEGLNIVGQAADADSLMIDNTTGNDTVEYAPGPTPDSGTLTGASSGFVAGGGPFAYVPITFTGITGSLDPIGGTSTAGNGTLLVDGTGNDDVFNVADITNAVSLKENAQSATIFLLPNATKTFALDIRGMGGNDAVNYTAATGASAAVYATTIGFQGGDSDSPFGDSVSYTAVPGTTATIGLAVSPNVQTITPSATGNVLGFTGAELATVNVSGTGEGVIVTGAAGDDSLSYTAVTANSAIFQDTIDGQLDSTSYTVNEATSGTAVVTFNGGAGSNGVVYNATKSPDAILLTATTGTPVISDNSFLGLTLGTGVQGLSVLGGTGNDALTVSFATTNPIPTGGLNFNGGGGFNSLILTGGTEGAETYSPGPVAGAGTFSISSNSITGAIAFQNLSPVFDNVSGPLVVNATNASNAINYKEGFSTLANYTAGTPSTTWGEVSVDNQEPEEFTAKTSLTINALAGSDTINLDNQFLPTALTGITINGGDPTGTLSDTLTVNGIAGTADNFQVTPTGTGAGGVTDSNAATTFAPVTYTGIEGLNIVGQTADQDSVATVATSGTDTVEYAPGPTPDAGSLTGFSSLGFDYVPITFSGIKAFVAPIGFGPATAADTLLIDGTPNDDIFTFNAAGGNAFIAGSSSIVVNGHTPIFYAPTKVAQVTLRGQGGNDTFNYLASATESAAAQAVSVTFQGGDSGPDPDVVNYTPLTGAPITVTLASAGNAQSIAAVGSNTVSFTGAEVANILAPASSTSNLTVTGTNNDDTLDYTPSSPTNGSFQLVGGATQFNFSNIGGTFLFDEGAAVGVVANTLVINGTAGRDTFTLDAVGRVASVAPIAGSLWKPVTLGPHVQVLTAMGLSGEDTFEVTPAAGTEFDTDGDLDNLVINVNGAGGGSVPALNALVVWSEGSSLPSTDFVVVNQTTSTSGIVRVYGSAVQWPDINYTNITTLSPQVFTTSGNGASETTQNLLILAPSNDELNNTLQTATYLGSAATIQVPNGAIFPNSEEFGNGNTVPADTEYYRVVAQTTGTLDFQVYFNLYAGLLPDEGALDIQAFDSAGFEMADAAGGASMTPGASDFGAQGTAGDARIRIPAIAGQTYYIEVFGAEGVGSPDQDSNAVNGYSMTVINTAPPTPYDGELSRSISSPDAGPPDTGDLPPGSAGDDSGRSQFDNVTNVNTPTVYFRLADAILLQDLQGNDGTTFTNNPPVGQIPIPFDTYTGFDVTSPLLTPGYRVAIFDGNNTQTPVGFAENYDIAFGTTAFPGLYFYTFTTALADGVHNILAAVQIIDPSGVNNPNDPSGGEEDGNFAASVAGTPQTGFGPYSDSLAITIDTVPPPVFFGNSSTGTIDGLAPGSDSGVTGQPLTFSDRITNVTVPTFFGMAEADAIVDVYAQESSSVQSTSATTQVLTINGTAGTFTLSYEGAANTLPLAFNASAAQVQAQIDTMFQFNTPSTNVSVTKSGDAYTVTFQSPPATLLAINATGLAEPELLLGQTTAEPNDGTNAFPGGTWSITSTINMNNPAYFSHDGNRVLTVTATDLAGNTSVAGGPGQTFSLFLDTQPPTVGGTVFSGGPGTVIPSIQITGSPNYNVFIEKTDGVPTPTPNVYQLTLNLLDPAPTDAPISSLGDIISSIIQTPGNITVTGAANGVIPIQTITVEPETLTADGQVLTPVIVTFKPEVAQSGVPGNNGQAEFGLPNDRYTVTISDALVDIAGNELAGVSNSQQPVANPNAPSGDGVPGSNFVGSFTVNSHPVMATYSDGTVSTDLNGNGTFDPTNTDFTDRDESFAFGLGTDTLFTGNLYAPGAAPGSSAVGFDKLGAYGLVDGTYRWLLDTTGDGTPTINGYLIPGNYNTAYTTIQAVQYNATPFTINYNGKVAIGLYDGNGHWYIDANGDDSIDVGDAVINTGTTMPGQPIVGNFNGNPHGFDDLATYQSPQGSNPNGTFYILYANPTTGSLTSGTTFVKLTVPGSLVSGAAAKPVAADINGDGITDLGLFLPGRTTQPTATESEWYFFTSNGTAGVGGRFDPASGNGTLTFDPYPLGTDVFYTYGNGFSLPLVGNFDPPPTSGGTYNSLPAMQFVTTGGSLAFSIAGGDPLSINDIGGSGQDSVSLTATAGTMMLATTAGLTSSSGNGSANISLTGSPASINAALNGLMFVAPKTVGPVELNIDSSEVGNSDDDLDTVSINVTSPIVQQGSTLTISGSSGTDNVSVAFQDSTHFTVTDNGLTSSYTTSSVNKVVFAGGTGHEAVSFSDAPAADVDTATLQLNSAKVTRTGFEFDATSAQTINVSGNARSIANLLDAAGGRFVATVTSSYLTGNGLFSQALGFGTVNAHAAATGSGSATFYAGTSSSVIASPTSTLMKGTGYLITAYNFPATYAYSDAAGTAVASFTANANSIFIGAPTYSEMKGAGYFNEAFNFRIVNAFGNASSTAYLYDSAGNDTLTASQATATLRTAAGVANNATSFGTVNAYSSTGHDTDHVTAIDFVLRKYGNWTNV